MGIILRKHVPREPAVINVLGELSQCTHCENALSTHNALVSLPQGYQVARCKMGCHHDLPSIVLKEKMAYFLWSAGKRGLLLDYEVNIGV